MSSGKPTSNSGASTDDPLDSIANSKEVKDKNEGDHYLCDLVPFLIDSFCISLRVNTDNKDNEEHDDSVIANGEEIEQIPYQQQVGL